MAMSRGKSRLDERRVRLHLSLGRGCEHSRLRLSMGLTRPLDPAELAAMVRVIESCVGEAPIITMHARESLDWLDDWAQTLQEALHCVGLVNFETTMRGRIHAEREPEAF
jgi:hypothetical protein